MDQQRWQKVQEVFHAALDRDASDRADFVRDACVGDDPLFEDVISLLDADSLDLSLLDGNAADVLARESPSGAADVADAGLEGEQVGPYRIVERIGAGGMGSVYLAERSDGEFQQRVALKVIKRGMDTDEILERFRAERQIVAQLQHPSIARLIDGGVTPDGRPYFTMEYVEGIPVDRYCDEHRLTVDERLQLFETICKAVQYAQHNLVVHRDLKPSNILVTREGRVKLLDFGIAKVVGEDAESPDGTPVGLTRTGARIMTPGYASPEQVRGEPVTTATDVYSLGVILFELLAGHRPYDVPSETPRELERAIIETPPRRPSTVVAKSRENVDPARRVVDTMTPRSIARTRRSMPDQLRRRLAGDLDNICLMALRKEPDRRYASAGLLLMDVERHRAGLPVTARKDTFTYRTQKFIQRHRPVVVTFVAVVAAIVALTVFYTTRLARERDRARLEAAKAAEVSQFLQSLFEVADPNESAGENLTARDILDSGAKRIETELAKQPEVQGKMLSVIANVYYGLGNFERAIELHVQALAVLREYHGDDEHLSVGLTMSWLGDVWRAAGDYDAARPLLEEGREIVLRTARPDDPEIGNVTSNVGRLMNDLGDYGGAERFYRLAIEHWTRTVGVEYPSASVNMNNLALVLHETGKHEESEILYRRALDIQTGVFGEVHPEVATTLYNLGQLLRDMGDLDAAEKIQRRGLEMDRRLYGDEHPDVAYSLNSLSLLLRQLGNFEEAEVFALEGLEMRRRLLGEEHPNYAWSLSSLAQIAHDRYDFERAEQLYKESLAIHLEVNGPDHPSVAQRYNQMGRLYYAWGRYEDAEAYHTRALVMTRDIFGEESSAVGRNLMFLANAIAARDRLDEALEMYGRGLEIARETRGTHSPLYATGAGGMGELLMKDGRYQEAAPLVETSLAQIRVLYGDNDLRTATAFGRAGDLYRDTGQPEKARDCFEKAVAIRRHRLPAGDPRIGKSQTALEELAGRTKQ